MTKLDRTTRRMMIAQQVAHIQSTTALIHKYILDGRRAMEQGEWARLRRFTLDRIGKERFILREQRARLRKLMND